MIASELVIQLGDVLPFLSNEEIGSPATISKLTAILSDQSKNVYLQIKLAAVVDAGKNVVKATYHLEGDGPLSLSCFLVIKELEASLHTIYNPNLDAVVRKLCALTHHSETPMKA